MHAHTQRRTCLATLRSPQKPTRDSWRYLQSACKLSIVNHRKLARTCVRARAKMSRLRSSTLRVALDVLFNILGCDFECSITWSVTLATFATGDGITCTSYMLTSAVAGASAASPADAKSVLNGRCFRLCAHHHPSVARILAHTFPISFSPHSRARSARSEAHAPFYSFTCKTNASRVPHASVSRSRRVRRRFRPSARVAPRAPASSSRVPCPCARALDGARDARRELASCECYLANHVHMFAGAHVRVRSRAWDARREKMRLGDARRDSYARTHAMGARDRARAALHGSMMCRRASAQRLAWTTRVVYVFFCVVLSARIAAGVDENAGDGLFVFDVGDGARFAPGTAIVVKARIRGGARRLVRPRLVCKNGYDDEREYGAMTDDGRWPDETAGDGVYAGRCETWGTRAGDMVRWRVQTDTPYMRAPDPRDGGDEYYGVALLNGFWVDTPLPVLHWYTPDSWAMTTDAGARVSLYFEGRFYDNVFARRRGSGRRESVIGTTEAAKDWPKHKFKLDFNGRRFKYDKSQRKVEEINLQSFYQEPGEETYMRETLAFHVFNAVGVPAPLTKYVHVRVNNDFYGLFAFIEQIDSTFLKRNYLDSQGPLYKAVNWKYSNLRAGDSSLKCPYATPDYPREWMYDECPEIWRKASKERTEDQLWELTQAIERVRNSNGEARILYDVLSLPEVINEMAAQTLVLSADRCAKNYYMHRDRGTGEWRRLPWDLEDAFPSDRRYGVHFCDPSECSAKSTAYCILSCEKFSSPLYCDRNHPQDIFIGEGVQDPKSTYNVLIDVLLSVKETREMYFTRLRTQMDEILATSFVDDWVRKTLDRIRNDALKDSEKWNVGGVRSIDQGVLQLLKQIVPKRREQLFKQYANMIPPSTPPNARVYVAYAQNSDPSSAYIKLSNPHGFAVDVSNWVVQSGNFKYKIKPGTVIGGGRSLFLVRDVAKFRERAAWARREYPEGVFIQGNLASDVPSDNASAFSVYKSTLDRVHALSDVGPQRNFTQTRFRPRIGFDNTSCVPPDIGAWGRFGDCCYDGECGLFCGTPDATRVRRRDVNVSLEDGIDDICLVENTEIDRTCAREACDDPTPPNVCVDDAVNQVVTSNVSRSVIFGSLGFNRYWENWSWDANTTEENVLGLNVSLASGGALAFQSRANASNAALKATGVHIRIARHAAPQPLPRLLVQLELVTSNSTQIFSTDAINLTENAETLWTDGCYIDVDAKTSDLRSDDDFQVTLVDAVRDIDPDDQNVTLKFILRHEFYSPLKFWLARVEVLF